MQDRLVLLLFFAVIRQTNIIDGKHTAVPLSGATIWVGACRQHVTRIMVMWLTFLCYTVLPESGSHCCYHASSSRTTQAAVMPVLRQRQTAVVLQCLSLTSEY
jgi:hypothetical protein